MQNRRASNLLFFGFVSLAGALALGGCGGTHAGGTSDDGGPRQDARIEDAGGATDGMADGAAAMPDEGGSDRAVPPIQCPAPTMEAGALPMASAPVCSAVAPSSPLIATFDGASPTAFAAWGTAPLVGGTYVYPSCTAASPEPSYPLFSDYSANTLHVTGTVGSYSGFGIWWVVQAGMTAGGYPMYAGGLIDASAYAGIQFDVSGNPGPLGAVSFAAVSANQQAQSSNPAQPTCGTCDSDAGVCNLVSFSSVGGLTSTPTTVRLRWSDLTTVGTAFDPAKLAGMYWLFPWVAGATPYPVDVSIDNVQFIPM